MTTIATVNETTKETSRRIVKLLGFGRIDVQKPFEASPHGVDSNPVKNRKAVYSKTENDTTKVVVGYIVEHAEAEPGETHFYATDTDGNEVGRIKMLTDGTVEILDNADFAVRYSELETAYNTLRDDFNSLVQAFNTFITVFNTHTHPVPAAAAVIPGTPPPTTPTTTPGAPGTPSTGDISGAKIEEIKVP